MAPASGCRVWVVTRKIRSRSVTRSRLDARPPHTRPEFRQAAGFDPQTNFLSYIIAVQIPCWMSNLGRASGTRTHDQGIMSPRNQFPYSPARSLDAPIHPPCGTNSAILRPDLSHPVLPDPGSTLARMSPIAGNRRSIRSNPSMPSARGTFQGSMESERPAPRAPSACGGEFTGTLSSLFGAAPRRGLVAS